MNRSIVEKWLEKASIAEKQGDKERMDYCFKKAQKAEDYYDKKEGKNNDAKTII